MLDPASCTICERVGLCVTHASPHLIHEFKNSFWVVGDHQFFAGYSLLLLKQHVRELHELPEEVRQGLFSEVMLAAQAVARAYQPWKLNYACYGNQDPHVHWHIFPRYESDPQHRSYPWVHAAQFASAKISIDQARQVAARLKSSLANPQ